LESAGFKDNEVVYAPVEGAAGNVQTQRASWHTSGNLLEHIERRAASMKSRGSCVNDVAVAPRILLHTATKDKGGLFTVSGRVECGKVSPGLACVMVPRPLRQHCLVQAVLVNGDPVSAATTGEAVRLRIDPDQPQRSGTTEPAACLERKNAKNSRASMSILDFGNQRTSQLELLLLSRPLVTLADTLLGPGTEHARNKSSAIFHGTVACLVRRHE
jgi:translation elongation factor EF-1alpha